IFWKLVAHISSRLPDSPLMDKRRLFYPLDMSRDDAMITETSAWLHPVTGKRHSATIEELAEQGVLRIITAFKDIEQQGSLSAALTKTPGENLLTGMHAVKQQEMKNFATPLKKKHLDTFYGLNYKTRLFLW